MQNNYEHFVTDTRHIGMFWNIRYKCCDNRQYRVAKKLATKKLLNTRIVLKPANNIRSLR